MLKIAVDEDRAEATVRALCRVAESLGEFEFGFQDSVAVGVAATEAFDRAVHAYGWRCAQVVSGSVAEVISDASAIEATVEAFVNHESGAVDALNEERRSTRGLRVGSGS